MINIVVTTCGEDKTINILNILKNTTDERFNVWVLKDSTKNEDVYEKINDIQDDNITHVECPMDGDFSKFRNHIHQYIDEGEWVLQLDADEMVDKDFIRILPSLLQQNDNVDLFYLPRNNFVNGITDEYVNKMGWTIDEKGRINYPDWQGRLYKLKEGVKWQGRVHENITGIKNYGMLDQEWAHLDHVKNFERQKKQNEYYEKLEE